MQNRTGLESIIDLIETMPFDYADKEAFFRIYDIIPDNYRVLIPSFIKIASNLIVSSGVKNNFVIESKEVNDRYKL